VKHRVEDEGDLGEVFRLSGHSGSDF
jgi:hypothetical protein